MGRTLSRFIVSTLLILVGVNGQRLVVEAHGVTCSAFEASCTKNGGEPMPASSCWCSQSHFSPHFEMVCWKDGGIIDEQICYMPMQCSPACL